MTWLPVSEGGVRIWTASRFLDWLIAMPARRLFALSLTGALVAALLACASSRRGTAVLVVRYPDAVRGCDYLGRLVPNTSDEGFLTQGALRQRVIETGGDTLLLVPAGSAEAWNCRAGRTRISIQTGFRPTPTPPFRAATPRAGYRF